MNYYFVSNTISIRDIDLVWKYLLAWDTIRRKLATHCSIANSCFHTNKYAFTRWYHIVPWLTVISRKWWCTLSSLHQSWVCEIFHRLAFTDYNLQFTRVYTASNRSYSSFEAFWKFNQTMHISPNPSHVDSIFRLWSSHDPQKYVSFHSSSISMVMTVDTCHGEIV